MQLKLSRTIPLDDIHRGYNVIDGVTAEYIRGKDVV